MNPLQLWGAAQWILGALGLSPETKEKEQEYKMKLMEAAERKDAATLEAWQQFQMLWHPPAERVAVWANTIVALFQPVIVAALYFDIFFGKGKSIQVATDLQKADIPGLLIMAILLFPLYGPFLGLGVGKAFQSAVELATSRRPETPGPQPKRQSSSGPEPTRPDRDGHDGR